jgi:fermentation-respiration switch protein FrsA (DUF1100 family)
MKKRTFWLITAVLALLLLVAYAAGSRYFASIMLSRPTSTLAETTADVGSPAAFGLPAPEEVRIAAGDVTLAGWFFENPAGGDCAVQFMHGYSGNRVQALYWAPIFWARGCDLLAYDHRGHGDSSPAYHTYGYYEKADGLAALAWLQARSGLPLSQIGVAGVSYGAATALQMAPSIPDAAFVLADSPYSSLEAIIRTQGEAQFGTLATIFVPGAFLTAEWLADFEADDVSPETAVIGADLPLLLIHSATDDFTPAAHSIAIFANSDPGEAQLRIHDWGAAHAADITTDFPAYKAEVDAFLDEFVGW